MRSIIRCSVAVAAATTLCAGAVRAEPAADPSGDATPFGVSALALPVADPAGTLTPEVNAVAFAPAPPRGTRFEAVRYRPRRSPYPESHPYHSESGPDMATPIQLHGGFFEPDGNSDATSFVLGMRAGPLLQRRVHIGAAFDWMHNSDKNVTVSGEPYSQGGVTITPQRVLAEASSDVLPLMGFLQVNLTDGGIVPYIGAGGGWQWLFLHAQDFETGLEYDASFGGWAWQAWGGAQLSLSKQARLFGEAYLHNGDASREVQDLNGISYDEVVDLSGVGMRFGLTWGY